MPPGDILVFLTGQEEIESLALLLQDKLKLLPPNASSLLVLALSLSHVGVSALRRASSGAAAGCVHASATQHAQGDSLDEPRRIFRDHSRNQIRRRHGNGEAPCDAGGDGTRVAARGARFQIARVAANGSCRSRERGKGSCIQLFARSASASSRKTPSCRFEKTPFPRSSAAISPASFFRYLHLSPLPAAQNHRHQRRAQLQLPAGSLARLAEARAAAAPDARSRRSSLCSLADVSRHRAR